MTRGHVAVKMRIVLGAVMAICAGLAAALRITEGESRLFVLTSVMLALCGAGLVVSGVLELKRSAAKTEGAAQPIGAATSFASRPGETS